MSQRRSWFSFFLLLIISPTAIAQPAKDPLRFVPSEAEWVTKVDRPRDILHAVEKNVLFQEAQKLAGFRELYDTTNVQQLYQLVAYFEKQLGKNHDEILDDISAGGLVIAARLTPPKGAMLVLQSRDDAKLRAFVDLSLDILTKELERQESKDKIVRKKYEGIDVGQIGPKFAFALTDGALIVASEDKVLKTVLDRHVKKAESKTISQVPSFADAQKSAPAKKLAWTWFNVEELRKSEDFKNGLDAASLDPLQVLLFGGFTNLLKRTPTASASLLREGGDGYRIVLHAPRGREGMGALSHMITPPDDHGTLPPLLPPRVISSTSYFLDLGQYWDKRVEILGEKNAKGLEEGDKNLAKVLGNIKLAKLLQSAGPHHRLVFAQQKESLYKIKPAAPFPSFALVVNMRDPSFAKDMNAVLRSAALLATFAVGLQLQEETYKDCEMVSYLFSETKKVEFDQQNVRFNFSPTYVACGDQFIVSATRELARDLIDTIKSQKKSAPSRAAMQTHVFATGISAFTGANEDASLTQLILAQALPPNTAKQELRSIIDWFNRLGTLRLEEVYGANDFRYEILWQPKKK
jgi:hypothetical protein